MAITGRLRTLFGSASFSAFHGVRLACRQEEADHPLPYSVPYSDKQAELHRSSHKVQYLLLLWSRSAIAPVNQKDERFQTHLEGLLHDRDCVTHRGSLDEKT